MPVVGRPITIHDLLTHTAGITGGIDETPEAAFQVWALRDPWLVFPDGSEDEQRLVPRSDGSFGVGDDPAGPEDVRFDAVADGRPRRAWLSGFPYYRVG